MKNAKWYYEISVKDKVALNYTQLPEFYGNMGSIHEMSDATLADLSFAVPDRGFVTHEAAVKKGVDSKSMAKAREFAKPLVEEFVRAQRDHLLSITDIAATVDRWNSLDAVQQAWITDYRQKLRDITKQDVFNVVWPPIPKALSFVMEYVWPSDIPLSAELKDILDGPIYVPTKEEVQQEKWQGIVTIREKRSMGGVNVQGKWFHSDTHSLVQYLALLAAGPNLPPGIRWKTMDGSFVVMTPALVQQVYSTAVISNNAIFQHAEVLRATMMTLKNPEAFDVSTGWPQVYADTLKPS